MKKKIIYEKYIELFDSSVKTHMMRYFNDYLRREYWLSGLVYDTKRDKWIIKLERK